MPTRRKFIIGASAVGLGYLTSNPTQALITSEPSQTASGAAIQRAAHQLLERPIVFEDPLSLRILGLEKVQKLAMNLEAYRQPIPKYLRAALVARSRLAEEELTRAYTRGVRQYIVLGAGLDTFAYRNPHSALRVYEIDHPSTQAWKKKRLEESNISVPHSVTFVGVDFERQTLASALHRTQFQFNEPAFVSWLGVTMYLTKEAVFSTLEEVSQQFSEGSEIVFDYSLPSNELTESQAMTRRKLAQQVEQIGEPWISHFNTAELSTQMHQLGYKKINVFTPEQINTRYFNGRSDEFRVRGSSRLICASNSLLT